MAKLLIKKKDGSVHIREKSKESGDNLEEVHPNKVKSWLALSEASHVTRGGTMEEIIQAVIDETRGAVFKEEKERVPVTQEEYDNLLLQCAKKGITKRKLDLMVVIVAKKEKTPEEMVEEFIRTRT